MSLAGTIGLGAGLAAATGVRPFAPALLAGALGADKALGLALDGTNVYNNRYSFLDSTPWLIAMGVLLVASYLLQARVGSERIEGGRVGAAVAGIGIGVGALLFAGILDQHQDAAWPGLIAGAACAALSQVALRPLLGRVRKRLADRATRDALTLYADVTALVIAALTVLLHPLGYVAVVALAWLALASRRRAGERFAGLRILRH